VKNKRDDSPGAQLRRELRDTVQALHRAYERFDQAWEAELVDASVYEISALKARYSYLIRKVREQEAAAAAEGGGACLS
jgi:hypothetical protein